MALDLFILRRCLCKVGTHHQWQFHLFDITAPCPLRASLPSDIPSLPLAVLTLMVTMTLPSELMEGLAWHKGGLLLNMGGLGCLQALAPMLVVLFHARGGIMVGLPTTFGIFPPLSSSIMESWSLRSLFYILRHW